MKIPCPICIPCADENDSPVLNLSAEGPDLEHFFQFGSTEPWVPPRLECPDCNGFPVYDFCTTTAQEAFGIPMDIWLAICTHNRVTEDPGGGFGPTGQRTLFFSNSVTVQSPCPDGSLFSYTTPMGLVVSKVNQQNADNMARSYAQQIARNKKCCLADLTSFGCVNQPYSATTTLVGGTPPYTYSIVAGALPPGLFPKETPQSEFLLQGTPYLAGNYAFTLQGNDSAGSSIQRTFGIAILQVANTVPVGVVGVPFSYTLVTTGGDAPYQFSLVSGALPSGLTLGQFGTISGTPTTSESTDFVVKVTDLNGFSCNFDLQMTVNPAVNWDLLQWTITQNLQIGAGTNTFSPLNGAFGHEWHDLSNSPLQPPDGARCQSHGDMTYNGTGANFNLHVVVNYTPDNGGETSFGVLEVTVNAVIVLHVNYQFPHGVNSGPGTYDYSLTLPNTGGLPIPVRIRTDQACGAISGINSFFEMTVTVTNA